MKSCKSVFNVFAGPKQKSIEWMRYITQNFTVGESKPEESYDEK